MKVLIAVMVFLYCIAYADKVSDVDSSAKNKKNIPVASTEKSAGKNQGTSVESEEHKKANRSCFNGCDYLDWSAKVEFSVQNDPTQKFVFTKPFKSGETIYLDVGVKVKSDFWFEASNEDVHISIAFSGVKEPVTKVLAEAPNSFDGKKLKAVIQATKKADKYTYFRFRIDNPTPGHKNVLVNFENETLNKRFKADYTIVVE